MALDAGSDFSSRLKAGTVGAVAVSALCTPLDVAKHAAQAALAARKATPGVPDTLRAAATPGLGGLFRGVFPALGRAAVSPAIFLVVYEQQKGSKTPVEAAVVARAVQTFMLQPLDFLRTCRQGGVMLPTSASAHLDRSAWQILSADGPKSFWRGGIPSVLRDVTSCGVFWLTYINLQKAAGEELQPMYVSGIACASAAAAAVFTQPLDVLKTRMQVHQLVRSAEGGYRKVRVPRVLATIRETYAAGGLSAFWTGGTARLIAAAATGLVLGPLFEYGHLVAQDADRPRREVYIVPPDTTNRIVHPRSQSSMYIEVK